MSSERVTLPRLSVFTLHYLELLAIAYEKQDLLAVRRYRRILTPVSEVFPGYRNEMDSFVRWGITTRIRCASSLNSPEAAALATLFVMYLSASAWDMSQRVCAQLRVYDWNVREDVSQLTTLRVLFLLGTPLLQHIRDARGLTSTLRLLARQAVRFSQPCRIQSYYGLEDRVRFSVFSYEPPRPDDRE